jgi:hypothetical protein
MNFQSLNLNITRDKKDKEFLFKVPTTARNHKPARPAHTHSVHGLLGQATIGRGLARHDP